MGLTKFEEKATEYAKGKSSFPVFQENHKKDFLAGYVQALQDSKAPEMLEMLNNIVSKIYDSNISTDEIDADEIEKLIKEATEL